MKCRDYFPTHDLNENRCKNCGEHPKNHADPINCKNEIRNGFCTCGKPGIVHPKGVWKAIKTLVKSNKTRANQPSLF